MSAQPHSHRRFNRGRWELQRERYRIEDALPPSSGGNARPLDEGITAALRAILPRGSELLAQLARDWGAMVGADVARHTRPAGIERGCLSVYVDSSPWLSELQRFGQKRILENVQKQLGENSVKTLRLRLDPDGGRR